MDTISTEEVLTGLSRPDSTGLNLPVIGQLKIEHLPYVAAGFGAILVVILIMRKKK